MRVHAVHAVGIRRFQINDGGKRERLVAQFFFLPGRDFREGILALINRVEPGNGLMRPFHAHIPCARTVTLFRHIRHEFGLVEFRANDHVLPALYVDARLGDEFRIIFQNSLFHGFSLKRPVAALENGPARALFRDARDGQLARADHKIDVHGRIVDPHFGELFAPV